jgi:pimeloyl-ACP methyl ester carboxylesterase
MPAVFVHGVPDTAVVWRPLLQRLKRTDVACVSLPGFGNQRPPGFKPDKDSYARWLVNELRTIKGPIDLVGHDWGSLLVTRAVSIAPDLVRSWSGGGAPLDPEYVWHDTAQIWQTPGRGEELMKGFTGEVLARGLAAQGIPPEMAREAATRVDDEMKSCILELVPIRHPSRRRLVCRPKEGGGAKPNPLGRARSLRWRSVRPTPRG